MFGLGWVGRVFSPRVAAILSKLRGRPSRRFRRRLLAGLKFRSLRFECAEPRRLLSNTVLLWSPGGDPSPEWTTDPNHTHQDWTEYVGGVATPSYWYNGDEADFPVATSLQVINIYDSAALGQGLVYASTIKILGGTYQFQPKPSTTGDELEIPTPQTGSVGTAMEVDSSAQATFGLPIVSESATGSVKATGPARSSSPKARRRTSTA